MSDATAPDGASAEKPGPDSALAAVLAAAKRSDLGLVVLGLLLPLVVATIAAFGRVDRRAALLLVPYLAWVCFATALNYGIWALN